MLGRMGFIQAVSLAGWVMGAAGYNDLEAQDVF